MHRAAKENRCLKQMCQAFVCRFLMHISKPAILDIDGEFVSNYGMLLLRKHF